tara:strand:- start:163 stop:432 length:270 start_codon:yes stop_codon:yes gene_type:complete
MTKKHYKIQSQESYWLEALSLFTDGCLNEAEIKQYKKDLAKRLADLVKNNDVLDLVSHCPLCNSDKLHQYKLHHVHCKDCKEDFNKSCG